MQAKDIMTKGVVCVGVKESIFDAAELMLGAGVSAVAVVNDKGEVVGIVSEADLLRRAEIGTGTEEVLAVASPGQRGQRRPRLRGGSCARVSDVMTREVVTADEQATLADLVELIEKHGVKRIPIVRAGKLVGVVSRADLLEALLSREPEGPVVQPTDKELRQTVIEALAHRPWASKWPTNVFTNDGVVHLWGFVQDDEVRNAYRVAAENVPGVRRVKNHLRSIPAAVTMGV